MEFEIGDSPASMAPDVAAAADKGMEVLLLAGFDSRIPSVSEAQNLGAWARTFGPGGTFWATRSDKALASRFIEFGNETSYSYQGTNNRGGEYALRFKDAYNAIQAANPRLGLLAQADDANCGCDNWVSGMAGTVPDLGNMVAGWTVHPYGPVSRWKPRIDELISQTAAQGWSSAIPIDITEYGMATDNGANLSDNYDWPTNQTYQQAGDAVDAHGEPDAGLRPARLASAPLHLLPGPRPAGLGNRPARALLRRHEERRLRQGRPHRRGDRTGRRAPHALTGTRA